MTDPKTRLIDLNKITIDERLQMRGVTDENVVDEYANLIADKHVFPPPVVFYDGKTVLLASGFHRVAAHRMVGNAGIKVEVHEGGYDEAFEYAWDSNNEHGIKMTNAMKFARVQRVLAHPKFGQLSDREIAERSRVSHTFVAEVRNPEKREERKAKKKAGEVATPRDKPTSKPGIQIVDPAGVATDTTKSQVIHKGNEPVDDSNEDPIAILSEEVERLTHRLAVAAAEGYTEEERGALSAGMEELQRAYRSMKAERDTIATQRDAFMTENAELKREVNRMRKKLDQALAKK